MREVRFAAVAVQGDGLVEAGRRRRLAMKYAGRSGRHLMVARMAYAGETAAPDLRPRTSLASSPVGVMTDLAVGGQQVHAFAARGYRSRQRAVMVLPWIAGDVSPTVTCRVPGSTRYSPNGRAASSVGRGDPGADVDQLGVGVNGVVFSGVMSITNPPPFWALSP